MLDYLNSYYISFQVRGIKICFVEIHKMKFRSGYKRPRLYFCLQRVKLNH